MFIKNLLRRRARTALTILGVAIGVAAIVALGALARGIEAGYGSIISGSQADLVISQPDAFDISYSAIKEEIGPLIEGFPEVAAISPMLEGFIQLEGQPVFFVFGYSEDSFILERFEMISGVSLGAREAKRAHGRPVMIGSAAAEVLDKEVGDTLRIGSSIFRIVGVYETGDAFEDSGAVLGLKDAQEQLGRPRQVNLFYVKLKDPADKDRFIARVERQIKDVEISGAEEFADKQILTDFLKVYVWVIGGLAIVIGGVGMMNTQLMSVFERTREIGVLRAVGWSSVRVLWMIMGESLVVCLLGGAMGAGLGYLMIYYLGQASVVLGVDTVNISPDALFQAFIVVFTLGVVAGLYPAWRASRLQPVEALRYEGGSGGGKVHRLPVGGMAVQSLWQRSTRTLLTIGAIGMTVGSIMALEGIMGSFKEEFNSLMTGMDGEVMIRQADISDTSTSSVDISVGEKLAALPEIRALSGVMFAAAVLPETQGFFILWGYDPQEFAIQRYKVVEGKLLATNHQIMLGRMMADAMHKEVGDTLDLSGVRFRVVGIFESNIGWEEMGGIVTLRDCQAYAGRPNKVTMYSVKLEDPTQGREVVEMINARFPDVSAALTGEFSDQLPDWENSNAMIQGMSIMAVFVGGVGVLNTMLMAVFERTREIGVMRSLGWGRRRILGLIMNEAIWLGLLGGLAGIGLAYLLATVLGNAPMVGDYYDAEFTPILYLRAIALAVILGGLGGIYPAFRATRLQPVEALRYE